MSFKLMTLSDDAILPKRQNLKDSGFDLYLPREVTIPANETVVIQTDIAIKLPHHYEGQIRSRSSVSLKGELLVHFGTIDFDYHKNLGIITKNLTNKPITLNRGDRIAQLVISPVSYVNYYHVDEFEQSERGGFGSTGK